MSQPEWYMRRVEREHLDFPEFTEVFDDGRATLMNFSVNRVPQASRLSLGSRLLVWVRETQRVFADMEITGSFEEGADALRAHGYQPNGSRHGDRWGFWYRPVRVLRRASIDSGSTIEEIHRSSGVEIRRITPSMVPVLASEYERIVAHCSWDYIAPRGSPGGHA